MHEIPVCNHKRHSIYVGGVMIPAGETRILPADRVPAHMLPRTVAESVATQANDIHAQLIVLLKGKVDQVRAALGALPDAQLAMLASLEEKTNGGAGRKGVLEAIAEARLQRASRAHLAEFEASLVGLDEDALLAVLDQVYNDLDKAERVQAALEALHTGDTHG